MHKHVEWNEAMWERERERDLFSPITKNQLFRQHCGGRYTQVICSNIMYLVLKKLVDSID